MGQTVELTGLVLGAYAYGDYDKRLVILTKERGKITAFARGARRPNSALLASTGVFAFGTFLLYEGRDAYNLVQANISNYFSELMNDFGAAYYGMYFCELADYFTRENGDEIHIMKLLYQSLRALSKKSLDRELVRYIYELKIFTYSGEYPEVFRCTQCGKEEGLKFFSIFHTGMVCGECKAAAKDGLLLNPSTVYALQYIVGAPVEKLYTFTVSAEVLAELRMILDRWREKYLEKRMKSLEILESVKDIC